MKVFSVIITTYNGEATISRALRSIFSQDGIHELFKLQVLLIDDCSTDNTLKIARDFEVEILQNERNSGGPNKGRNKGLKFAEGDFITFVDQDDEWLPNRIKGVLEYCDKVPIVSSGFIIKDSVTNKSFQRVKSNPMGYLYYPNNQTFLDKLTRSNKGQNTYLGSIVYASSLKNITFEEEYGMVDFDWILRLFHQQDSIEIALPLYIRYIDQDNLSLDKDYRRNDFEFSKSFIRSQFESSYPAEVRKAIKRMYGSRARYYFLINDMKQARYYFRKSELTLKTIAYYCATYVGASYVKKRFNVFG